MAKKKSKNTGKKPVAKETSEKIDSIEKPENLQSTTQNHPIKPNSGNNDEFGDCGTTETEQEQLNMKTNEKMQDLENQHTLLEKQLEDLKLQLNEKDEKLKQLQKEKEDSPAKDQTQLGLENSENFEQTGIETQDCDRTAGEIEHLKAQLAKKTEESEKNKANYDALLKRVSQMKGVFENMKKSEKKLELLELENKQLKEKLDDSSSQISALEELKSEIVGLNSECAKLVEKNSLLTKELELQELRQSRDFKNLEDENKSLKKKLKETRSELEEYLILVQEERLTKAGLVQEVSNLTTKIANLEAENMTVKEKAKELSEELMKVLESRNSFEDENKKTIEALKSQLATKVEEIDNFTKEIDNLKKHSLEKDEKLKAIEGLEKSLKEKQLLIGKLRHETITLNEHLTKAMRLIKKESGKETVDRELVSNLFISFLQIPRGDTKKFEVLQLLANFLDWDDDKRRHAGLLSSGDYRAKSNSVVEVPQLGRRSVGSSQSFVSLWTEFLEKESTPKSGALPDN